MYASETFWDTLIQEDNALAHNMYVQYRMCLSMKVLNHIEPRDSLQYLGKHY